jgi:hypothetical protein
MSHSICFASSQGMPELRSMIRDNFLKTTLCNFLKIKVTYCYSDIPITHHDVKHTHILVNMRKLFWLPNKDFCQNISFRSDSSLAKSVVLGP